MAVLAKSPCFVHAQSASTGFSSGALGGQSNRRQPSTLGVDEVARGAAPVRAEPVPDQDGATAHVALEVSKEPDDLRRTNVPRVELHENSRALAIAAVQERPDCGHAAPGSSSTRHDRRLPFGRPRTPQRRALRKPRLVHEDQRSAGPAVFWGFRNSCGRL